MKKARRKILALMVRILSSASTVTPIIPATYALPDGRKEQLFFFGGMCVSYELLGDSEELLTIKLPEHKEGGDENRQAVISLRNGIRCEGVEFELGVSNGFGPLTLSSDSELPGKITAIWHAHKRAVGEGEVDGLWDEGGYYAPNN